MLFVAVTVCRAKSPVFHRKIIVFNGEQAESEIGVLNSCDMAWIELKSNHFRWEV